MKQSLEGPLLVAISAFFFGSYGIWSRLMLNGFDAYSQGWIRGVILLLLLVPFGLLRKSFKNIQKKDIIWFAIFSLCGGLNQAPYFYGFAHLSIGTATLLFYLALTASMYILGPLFFQEKLTHLKFMSLAFAVIGLFVIYKFALLSSQIFPALLTLLAGAMGGTEVTFSKKISSHYSQIQLLVVNFGVMTLGNGVISLFLGARIPAFTNYSAWGGQIGYVVAMLLAMVSVIVGFKHLEPSVGGVIGLLEVVFAAMFGVIFFRESLTLQLIIGGGLILFAAGLSDGVEVVKKMSRRVFAYSNI